MYDGINHTLNISHWVDSILKCGLIEVLAPQIILLTLNSVLDKLKHLFVVMIRLYDFVTASNECILRMLIGAGGLTASCCSGSLS